MNTNYNIHILLQQIDCAKTKHLIWHNKYKVGHFLVTFGHKWFLKLNC